MAAASRHTFAAGDTYALAPDSSEDDVRHVRALGFRAVQFNLVVATNERAVRLGQRLGVAIVGRLPGAFRHGRLGFVDAFVMYETLADRGRRG